MEQEPEEADERKRNIDTEAIINSITEEEILKAVNKIYGKGLSWDLIAY